MYVNKGEDGIRPFCIMPNSSGFIWRCYGEGWSSGGPETWPEGYRIKEGDSEFVEKPFSIGSHMLFLSNGDSKLYLQLAVEQ